MTIAELQGYKKILLLGYGKEGQASERFLKMFVPGAEILIADQASDPNYLERQSEADLVIKTPAIPKCLVTKPYTTGTNIFFANVGRPVVGITGSKGKSTTTALIAAILKEAGKNVRLVGNIGHAALGFLCEPREEDEVFVMELSSYQLDDIQYAPYIAVFVSFFPEHLDYHGSLEEYFKAKSHITTFQKETDVFCYHPDYPEITKLAGETKAQAIPFRREVPFSLEQIPLAGEHNIQNIVLFPDTGVSIKACLKARGYDPHYCETTSMSEAVRFAYEVTPPGSACLLSTASPSYRLWKNYEEKGDLFAKSVQELAATL